MTGKLSDDLITLSTMMMVARERKDFINLAGEMNAIIQKAMDLESTDLVPKENKKTLSATIKFTKQEIDKMSKTFKKEFIANGCVSHIIKRPSGKNGVYYEIRYRRNGYNITVSNKDLKKAKELFIVATYDLEPHRANSKTKLEFGSIVQEWLEYKKGTVIPHTYQQYENRIARFIPEEMKNKLITDIHTNDIDKIVKSLSSERMYEEIRSLFNQIFHYAVASGIMTYNPVTLITFKRADRKNRDAMTEEQVKEFLQRIKEPRFDRIRQCAYAIYFFGLRPCELDDEARFENGFLICRNRKRKNGKIEYKKIPVPKQAQGLIDLNMSLAPPLSYSSFLEAMKHALGDCKLTPYNLRHTFASACAEAVREEIVDVWMGDSPERLVGRVYIHYSDEFMKEQMNQVKFTII